MEVRHGSSRGGGRAHNDSERDRVGPEGSPGEGAGSLEVSVPADPGVAIEQGGLTKPPCLVKVDRYGSVSGLVRVRVPLGFIVLEYPPEEVSFGS